MRIRGDEKRQKSLDGIRGKSQSDIYHLANLLDYDSLMSVFYRATFAF